MYMGQQGGKVPALTHKYRPEKDLEVTMKILWKHFFNLTSKKDKANARFSEEIVNKM